MRLASERDRLLTADDPLITNDRARPGLPTPKVSFHLSADEQTELRALFESADADRSGYLDLLELRQALKRWSRFVTPFSNGEVAKLVREFDVDGSGTIDFDEFVAIAEMLARQELPPSGDGLDAIEPKRKLRLLALHGSGDNAKVAKLQMANLGLDDVFHVDYIDGPFECAPSSETAVVPGPYYTWIHPDESTGGSIGATLAGMRRVIREAIARGRYDGVFGFSLGGTVALSLLQRDVLSVVIDLADDNDSRDNSLQASRISFLDQLRHGNSLGVTRSSPAMLLERVSSKVRRAKLPPIRHSSSSTASFYDPPFRFAIVACPSSLSKFRRSLGLDEKSTTIMDKIGPPGAECRTVHLIGSRDPLKPSSEANILQHCFLEGSSAPNAFIKYLPVDHELPRTLRNDKKLAAAIAEHVTAPPVSYIKSAPDSKASADSQGFSVPVLSRMATEVVMSKFVTAYVDPRSQVVSVELRPPAHAKSIAAAIIAAPGAGCYARGRVATNNSAVAVSYGEVRRFVVDGATEVASRLGLEHLIGVAAKDAPPTVAYATPPDGTASLVAGLAFLLFASIGAAAPIEATASERDASDFAVQLRAATIVCWKDGGEDGIRSAALHVGAGLFEASMSFLPLAFDLQPVGHTLRDNKVQTGLSFDCRRLSVAPQQETQDSRIALLLRTSGTTSKPKVVALREHQVVTNGFALSANLGLEPTDVCLNAMPLYHIGGLSASILATLAAQSSVTCLAGQFAAEAFVDLLSSHVEDKWPLPTWYSAVPTMHNALVAHLSTRVEPLKHGIRFVRSGAAALSPYDARQLSATFGGVPVIATYSMSEQMPITQPPFGFGRRQLEEKAGTVGVAVATSLAVVGEDLTPLKDDDDKTIAVLAQRSSSRKLRMKSGITISTAGPIGRRSGQIAICGPCVMDEYLDNPAANASSFFVLNGKRWFLTGDVGYLDEEGHLRLTGRSKELIKRGGEQVSPYEIEDVLVENRLIKIAVVFAVPSELWGEEVGVAIVPSEPEQLAREDLRAWRKIVRSQCAEAQLSPAKVPTHIVVVDEHRLPKTKTRKFVRINLAKELLDVGKSLPGRYRKTFDVEAGPDLRGDTRGPPTVSAALSGARFILVVWTMYQHLGSGRSFGKWKQARGFNLHMPMFFALAGFQLASGMAPPPSNLYFLSRSHRVYFWARFSSVHPLYLFSIACCAILLLLGCRPDTYRQDFDFEANKDYDHNFNWRWSESEDDDGDVKSHAFCEPTPVDLGTWGASYASSIATYALGLQAWPFAIAISWFVSFYTWFQSVYYFCLWCFPLVYSRLYKYRNRPRPLLVAMAVAFAANNAVCALFFVNYFRWARHYRHAAPLALALYLFPPFWTPHFFAGVIAAFLLDCYRPSRRRSRAAFGAIADGLSIYFGAAVLGLRLAHNSLRPPAAVTNKLLDRTWAYTCSRLHFPFVIVWLFALAVGEGRVANCLASNTLAKTLGPLSFAAYLFHQVVGIVYYALTRNAVWNWWRYRKFFYWFSPYPTPVPWYEAFWIMALTVGLSKVLTDVVNPRLVEAWNAASFYVMRWFTFDSKTDDPNKRCDTLETVCEIVAQLAGTDVEPDYTLEQCGLASVGLPVLIRMLTNALPGLTITAADFVSASTLRELSLNIEARLAHNEAAHIM